MFYVQYNTKKKKLPPDGLKNKIRLATIKKNNFYGTRRFNDQKKFNGKSSSKKIIFFFSFFPLVLFILRIQIHFFFF